MISKWDNGIGHRNRKAVAVLVTEDGRVHHFTGMPIEGVCSVSETGYKKNGKWSYTTFDVLHRDTTVFLSWMQDWDLGYTWPQSSWEAGFIWLAERTPAVSWEGFQAFIREKYTSTAERWDSRAEAEKAVRETRPLEHAAKTAALVAAMKAKLAEQEKQAAAQESRLADVRRQARSLERTFDRTENVRREAEAIAETALKIAAECDAQAAKDKSFGAGAFDELAGLKL